MWPSRWRSGGLRLRGSALASSIRCGCRANSSIAIENVLPPIPPPIQVKNHTLRQPSGRARAIYIAATREHTGKTSVSMALLSGLISRYGVERVGYMKPVGQKWMEVEEGGKTFKVDKDVKVAKEHWKLKCHYADMSPIVLGHGYTRRFLDGEIDADAQLRTISEAFERLSAQFDILVVEGTGHTGVGSIVGLNNAAVASLLGLDVVLVANGGLGSTFDMLEINRQMCISYGVTVSGIIVNKVHKDRVDESRRYLTLALGPWNARLIGLVPFSDSLDVPSAMDLERLFGAEVLSTGADMLKRFTRYELVTTSLRRFMENLTFRRGEWLRTCFITHGSRSDIILGLLGHSQSPYSPPFEGGLLLTGSPPGNKPHAYTLPYVRRSQMPVMTVGQSTTTVLAALESFTPKMSADDSERTMSVVGHYEPFLDFNAFEELLDKSGQRKPMLS